MRPRTFHPKLKRSKKTEALSRLKILWEEENEGEFDPSLEPKITPMLRSVPGGFRAVMEALRMHNDEDARKFVRLYDSRTASDRENLRIEDIAFASGVGSLRLAEVAQTALFLYAQMRTKMLVSAAMPKVMKSTIKAATDEVPIVADVGDKRIVVGKTNGDTKAMEMFHKISGMMPLPKGAQIAIQNNFPDPDSQATADTPSWRPAEDRLREFQEMTEPRRLPSPESKPVVIGGRIDHMQAETVEILRED